MPRPRQLPPSLEGRRLAVWLLAFLVCAHSLGASVLATLGPSHVHRSSDAVVGLEYFDLRRAPVPRSPRPGHMLTAFGHFHASGGPDRHHHRGDDVSVVVLEDGASPQADESACAAFAALAGVALLPAPMAWMAAADREAPLALAAWPSLTHDSEPLERPPRDV